MPKGNWREFNAQNAIARPQSPSPKNLKNTLSVRVQKIKAGRKGKTVTVITGLELDQIGFRKLLKALKAKAGTGGTVKEDSIELQGDHVTIALQHLQAEGYKPKKSGG